MKNFDALSFGTIVKGQILVHTNWKAPRRRVLAASLKKLPQKPSDWREIIPESDTVIESFSKIQAAGGKIFIKCIENAVPLVKVFETNGEFVRDIHFPVIGTVTDINGQWESSEVFFSFTSYFIPARIYRYDAAAGTPEIWAQVDAPVKSDNIRIRQVWYQSGDGTRIPMFLVHQKGIKLDGSNPTLLTGYGGFNLIYSPRFISFGSIWLENGGVFASPGLRGGGEFGEEWHRAGKLEKKQTVFDDFTAAAEWLIENGYTNPEKLAIFGASNGGLLVSASFTQKPGLFKAAVCQYPLIDMIRYHEFLDSPIWATEYGIAEDPDQFKYLYAYSPYHHVTRGTKYPAVLFISGDADTRVAPPHALKMTALLQNMTGSRNPVLLYYGTKLGHGGGQPVSKQIEETTYLLSFIFWQLDIPFNK
jgi:prolyl oligopeptidase